MKIELGGKYTTRDGRPVRILCVDGPGAFPVVGLVPGSALPDCWQCDGSWSGGHDEESRDLIPAKPEPVVEWGLLIDGDKFMPGTSRMVAEDALSRGSYGPAARLAKRTTTTEIIEP